MQNRQQLGQELLTNPAGRITEGGHYDSARGLRSDYLGV